MKTRNGREWLASLESPPTRLKRTSQTKGVPSSARLLPRYFREGVILSTQLKYRQFAGEIACVWLRSSKGQREEDRLMPLRPRELRPRQIPEPHSSSRPDTRHHYFGQARVSPDCIPRWERRRCKLEAGSRQAHPQPANCNLPSQR